MFMSDHESRWTKIEATVTGQEKERLKRLARRTGRSVADHIAISSGARRVGRRTLNQIHDQITEDTDKGGDGECLNY